MFLEINRAKYLEEYKIRMWFNNGEVRDVDLAHSLKGEVFEPLRDKKQFQHFSIRFNTIEWENGADFAPEYLYENSVPAYDTSEVAPSIVAEAQTPYKPSK